MFYSYSWFHDTECTSWEKIEADQLRIHLYVFGILNRLKVNSSDGLQMRKGYVSLFSPLKLTDADLQSMCVRPWVKNKFRWKWCTQLLFTMWMARLTRHSIHASMPQISITTKSAAEFTRCPSFPITLINSFRIDQTVRKPTEQMRFIRMCPLACFEQDNVRWGSWTDYTDTNENHQNESSVKNKHEKMDINSQIHCHWHARTISILEDTQPWLSDIYRPLRRASPWTTGFQKPNAAGRYLTATANGRVRPL